MTAPEEMGILPDGVNVDLTGQYAPPEQPEELAPEPEPDALESDLTPEPEVETPAAADPMAQVQEVVQMMRENAELQRQQLQPAPAQPAAWVDPYDRPENVAKLDELEERVTYDASARAELRAFKRSLDDERLDYRVAQREQTLRAELTAGQQVQQVRQTLQTEAMRHGDLVDVTTLHELENEVLRDSPDHVRAQALSDPKFRQIMIEAAAGRRVLSGKATPTAARPPVPAQVRSSDRAPAPSKARLDQWNDPEYLDALYADAYNNPAKYRKE